MPMQVVTYINTYEHVNRQYQYNRQNYLKPDKAKKICYPIQNDTGCIHFVVVSSQHLLERHGQALIPCSYFYCQLLMV